MGKTAAHMSKRSHVKGYCIVHSPLLPIGGRGKSLRVWMRLDKANKQYAKEVLYDEFSPAGHGRET